MKKSICIFLALFFIFLLSSCFEIDTSITATPDTQTEVPELTFPDIKLYEKASRVELDVISGIISEYDADEHIIKQTHVDCYTGNIKDITLYTYKKGRLTEKVFSDIDGSAYRTVYKYDKSGYLIKMVTYRQRDGEDTVVYSRVFYECDESGRVLKRRYVDHKSDTHITVYTYGDDGRISDEHEYLNSEKNIVSHVKYTYKFGVLANKRVELGNVIEYEYYSDGSIKTKTEYGSNGAVDTVLEYEYGDNEEVTIHFRSYSDGIETKYTEKCEYFVGKTVATKTNSDGTYTVTVRTAKGKIIRAYRADGILTTEEKHIGLIDGQETWQIIVTEFDTNGAVVKSELKINSETKATLCRGEDGEYEVQLAGSCSKRTDIGTDGRYRTDDFDSDGNLICSAYHYWYEDYTGD